MAVKLTKTVDSRVNGEFLIGLRNARGESYENRMNRLRTLDDLYKGNFTRVFPNEDYDTDLPTVMNLVQVGIDDFARLVAETLPSVNVLPKSDSETDRERSFVQEAIFETYWDVNDGNILTPRLAMDLAGAGACFLVVDTHDREYPCLHRIDPRYAYPDVYNGKLQDLLVVQTLKLRQAARIFPRLELGNIPSHIADGAEVVEYYSADECVQGVALTHGGSPIKEGMYVTKRWKPEIGMPPVAFVQLDTFDGDFRGMFDQIAGTLNTKNKIVKQMLDYSDRLTYAPLVSKGLMNQEEQEGPNAHYRLDPNTPDSQMGRLQPAGSAPQLFALLDMLEREQRGGASYPAQRQGDVNQSIASASFVNSTMGHLTTSVRNLQRLLGSLRERTYNICMELDKKHLDKQKQLSRSIGKKTTYTPSKDFDKTTRPRIIYGAGAGLDRLNADVRVLQHLGAGLISRETAREQIDYLEKDGEEEDRIQRELASSALSQKFLAEAPWDMVSKVYAAMENGDNISKAITTVMAQAEQDQAAQAAAQPQSPTADALAPGGGAAGQGPADQQTALQKGSTQPVKFPNEPLTNILVTPGR